MTEPVLRVGGRVDGDGLLGAEAQQVVGSTRLRTRSAQPFAAEGLHADHRADDVAVDIDVADPRAAFDPSVELAARGARDPLSD